MQDDSRKKKQEFSPLHFEYAFGRGFDVENRIIQLTEDIEDHHFDFFDTAMNILESKSKKTITIKINSYGGDVYTALAIIGRMRESRCRIHTKGYGKIMSASTAILAAGTKRSMSELAEFMHHESSYAVEGRHSEIQHEVKVSQRLSEKWYKLMHQLTGIPSQYWGTKGVGTDYYLTPQKCLQLNIIDELF